MISAPREEANGRIVIEWLPSKERTRYQFSNRDEKAVLRVKEPGIGGFYEAGAFPLADASVDLIVNGDDEPSPPAFTIGDQVKIDTSMNIEYLESQQKEVGGFGVSIIRKVACDSISYYSFSLLITFFYCGPQFIGVVGTVHTIFESEIFVRFKGKEECLNLNPTILIKLNKFSVNQVIRVRNDESTLQQMEKELTRSEVRKALKAVCINHRSLLYFLNLH